MDVTIAGSTYTFYPNEEELARISLEFAAFDGEVGFGTFPLPDPGESIIPVTGRQFRVDEIDTLLTDGFTLDWDRARGPFRVGAEREYNMTVADANALLGGFIATITRPSETDYARVIAFATQYRPTWDTTWVLNSATVTMPTKKYDSDQGFGELIPDLVEFTGKTLFVHDKALGGRCLHYHVLTTGHTCGLTISDVASAVNGTTVFAPIAPAFQRTSVDLRNVVEGRDQAGRRSILTDPDSVGDHNADGLYHQSIIEFETTGQADLEVKTAAYIASSKNDYDTRTVGIGPLDATALALIRVGDLITVTSAVLGLTAVAKRIAHMTLTPWGTSPAAGLWQAQLELEAPLRRRARVKTVQKPPAPPPPFDPNGVTQFISTDCLSSLLWSPGASSGGGTFSWDPDVPPRVVLSTVGSGGNQFAQLTGTPWALDTDAYSVTFYVTFNSTWLDGPTISDNISIGVAGGTSVYGLGLRMLVVPSTHVGTFETQIGAGPPVSHGITWVAGQTYVVTFTRNGTGASATLNGTGDSGTLDPADSNQVGATMTSAVAGAEAIITTLDSQICTVNEGLAPVDGQPFSEIIGTGDGSTTAYNTDYPYVPLSMHLFVDGLEEFGFTETDPTTGDFTFDVAPALGEEIRVSFVMAVNLG